jgi:predicted secreted Zn-dependent protease
MKLTKAALIKIIKEELRELEIPSIDVSEKPHPLDDADFDWEVAKEKLDQFERALPVHDSHLREFMRDLAEFDRYVKSTGLVVPDDPYFDDLRQMRIAVMDVVKKLEKSKPREILDRAEQPPRRPRAGHLAHLGKYVTNPDTGQRMYAKSGPKGNK